MKSDHRFLVGHPIQSACRDVATFSNRWNFVDDKRIVGHVRDKQLL